MHPSDEAREFLRKTGPNYDLIQKEMIEYADRTGFPIIGPETGSFLEFLSRVTNATKVFEFGSGFGYSAYWFIRGMTKNGQVILTEVNGTELKKAEEFLSKAKVSDQAIFEIGDAREIVRQYQCKFDIILMDHQKELYAESFEIVRDKIANGGVIIADNMMRGPVKFEELLEYFERDDVSTLDADVRSVGDYLDMVTSSEEFFTTLLPIGNGVAITISA